MNQQPPLKSVAPEDGTLLVRSIFYTIQGEGPYTGERAVFIRLGGCNLQCPQCDTDYTNNTFYSTPQNIADMAKDMCADEHKGHLVVITGGEPFRQPLGPLVDKLLEVGFKVQIETNGTLYQELSFAKITVVCSPKAGSINKHLAKHIDALKYVIDADDVGCDGLPLHALGHPAEPQLARPPVDFTGTIYVQPMDEGSMNVKRNAAHLNACIRSVLSEGYTLCLQTHKLIDME